MMLKMCKYYHKLSVVVMHWIDTTYRNNIYIVYEDKCVLI
jgi:hypothetical protein